VDASKHVGVLTNLIATYMSIIVQQDATIYFSNGATTLIESLPSQQYPSI